MVLFIVQVRFGPLLGPIPRANEKCQREATTADEWVPTKKPDQRDLINWSVTDLSF